MASTPSRSRLRGCIPTDSGTYIVDPSIGIFGRSCNGGLGTSQRLGELYLGFSPTGIFRGCRVGVDCTE